MFRTYRSVLFTVSFSLLGCFCATGHCQQDSDCQSGGSCDVTASQCVTPASGDLLTPPRDLADSPPDLLPACVSAGALPAIPVTQTDVRVGNDVFGSGVSLDGNLLLVGAYGVATSTGAAYLFSAPSVCSSTVWTLIIRFLPAGMPA